MPVLTFETLDAVPETLREFAKTQDDKVTVNVVPEVRLSEFRDTNIAVSKERDELRGKVDSLAAIVGEDADAFVKELEELRQTRERVVAGELKEGRALEEAVGKRTEEMRKKFEEELQAKGREGAAWRQKFEMLDRDFRQAKVVQAVKDAIVVDGTVLPTAMGDVAERALKVFKVMDDGKLIPMNGDAPIYGANGVDPMTPAEWLVKLKDEAPHFYKGTSGGGAGGESTKKGTFGMTAKELANLTPAQKLELANQPRRGA